MRHMLVAVGILVAAMTLCPSKAAKAVSVRYASRHQCQQACGASISSCRAQAASARARRRCRPTWIKACSRFLGLDLCTPPDLRGAWEFEATQADPPNACTDPSAPVLISIATQGPFDLTGAAPIGGVFADASFLGTLVINPTFGVGFSLTGHGDQLAPCYFERSVSAATCQGVCVREGSYTVRKFCTGGSNPVCEWGATGTLSRRP